MQRVLVIDKHKQALMPCQSARARQLLREGQAAVFRRFPFTIILTEREGGATQPVEFKVDPGSKTSGVALVGDFKRGKRLLWAAEMAHRGQTVTNHLQERRTHRQSRRARHTRYRPAASTIDTARQAGYRPRCAVGWAIS